MKEIPKNYKELRVAFHKEVKSRNGIYVSRRNERWTLILWWLFNHRRKVAYMTAIVMGKHHIAAFNEAKKLK